MFIPCMKQQVLLGTIPMKLAVDGLSRQAAVAVPRGAQPQEPLPLVIAWHDTGGSGSLARIYFGIKGAGWYWGNWLLHVKLAMFVLAAALSIQPTRRFIRLRRELRASGALPPEAEVTRTRKLVMVQAHIVPLIPLAASFLARGFGGR